MDVHKNARLTPKGRKAMVRTVVDNALSYTQAARHFHTTPKTVAKWVRRFRAEGVAVNYMRLRALPLNDEVTQFIERNETVYVVEQNRDGQMAGLLKLHAGDIAHKTRSILHYDGLPIDAKTVFEGPQTRCRKSATG